MLRHRHETLQEQALREAQAAGGIAGGTPLPGGPEELLAGPEYTRAAVRAAGAGLGIVPFVISTIELWADNRWPAIIAGLATLLSALWVTAALRFRLSVDPAGVRRRRLIGSQVIPWRDFNCAILSLRQKFHFDDEGGSEFTPYRVLVVYTRGGRAVKVASPRGLFAPRPEELENWAEAINRWAKNYSPRQRQGA